MDDTTPLKAESLLTAPAIDERYSFYARLRDDAPVLRWPLSDRADDVLLTRHADVETVLRRRSSRKRPPGGAPAWLGRGAAALLYESRLVTDDPPAHTRVRSLLGRHFTPRAMAALIEQIEQGIEQCLAELDDRPEIEAVRDFAEFVPATAICSLLGVAPTEWTILVQRASDFVLIFSNTPLSTADAQRCERACTFYVDYFRELIAHKRRFPGSDLASELVGRTSASVSDRLSDNELVATLESFLTAGFETTQTAIANGLLALSRHPAVRARAATDPGVTEGLVEEILRWEAPLHFGWRYLGEPLTVGDQTLDPGRRVQLGLAAANHDPRRFAKPDNFDPDRADNGHLSFGAGPHHCLGAYLARIEIGLAVTGFARHFPEFSVDEDALPRRRRELTFPSLPSLPLTTGPTRFAGRASSR